MISLEANLDYLQKLSWGKAGVESLRWELTMLWHVLDMSGFKRGQTEA